MGQRILFFGAMDLNVTSAPKIHFLNLATAMKRKGLEVRLLIPTPRLADAARDCSLVKGLGHSIVPIHAPFRKVRNIGRIVQSFYVLPFVIREMFRFSPHILYVRFDPLLIWSFLVVRFLRLFLKPKTKIVAEMNGWLADQRRISGDSWLEIQVSEWFEKIVLRFVDQIRAVTEGLRNKVEHVGFPKERCFVVRNGTDVDHFKPIDGKQLKKQMGIGEKRLVLGFMGHLTRWQGVEVLIRAVPKVREHLPEVEVFIVGDGPERKNLEQLAASLALDPKIRFLGRVPYERAPEYLSIFNCAVAPFIVQRNESIGLSPLKIGDTAASGVPLVASRIKGLEFVEKENIGVLVVPEDAALLADAILKVLDDKEQRLHFSKKARKFAEEHLSWGLLCDQLSQQIFPNKESSTTLN